MPSTPITLSAVHRDDAEALAALRVLAMRESLERVGRFDPMRARDRLLSGFSPQQTRHVLVDGERAGFLVVKPDGDGLLLDHLYIDPRFQHRGFGAQVLAAVFAEADAMGMPLRVGALRGSGSNRFYLRHGFVLERMGEWDDYYVRAPQRSGSG
jgi:GNAT superfamily N-acetyltransferase